ncbi:TIGR03790 family protein [Rubritalea spongiae]|uniref:TIGR03790 family protein n=1 Tax=Rubritalea spongiae TaxID=430797 RepID=A0ABW5E6X9_9BACT
MKFLNIFILFLFSVTWLNAKPSIEPSSIAILYNSNMKESSELAFYYAKQRNIPLSNLVGLDTSNAAHISREQYKKTIEGPLRRHFTHNRWWKLQKTTDGFVIPTDNKIRLLVCVYGIPFGIQQVAIPKEESDKLHTIERSNKASVDSELNTFGIQNLPLRGAVPNPYFKQEKNFSDDPKNLPYVMVGRIDGPSPELAKRLIDDAIATEKQGLWGMCYLDMALKGANYKEGDDWIENIYKLNWQKGIPTVIDRNKQTYLTNYPMRDAALYYGWYTSHKNGPLLDPEFRFKRGAVAMHLHSASASNLRNPDTHWVGPILNAGAAATIGNVYEPYLALTHHFDILNERLMNGYTFIEAATMSLPTFSWMNVSVGDPLYRPFKHISSSGEVVEEDKAYRAMSLAFRAWKNDDEKIERRLQSAAIQKNDARFYEVIGLWKLSQNDTKGALSYFYPALSKYTDISDKVRVTLHLANLFRGEKQKAQAIDALEAILAENDSAPATKAASAMLTILNPPPPPAAQPRQDSADK